MIGKTKSLLTSLALLALASATLSVYNLQALGENDQALLNISYSIANYGFAPYPRPHPASAKPSSANSSPPPNSDRSAPPKQTPTSTTVPPPPSRKQVHPHPTRRVRVRHQNPQRPETGSADGHHNGRKRSQGHRHHDRQRLRYQYHHPGYKVSIPSLFIHYEDGEKLKALLEDNDGEDDADVIMKITF